MSAVWENTPEHFRELREAQYSICLVHTTENNLTFHLGKVFKVDLVASLHSMYRHHGYILSICIRHVYTHLQTQAFKTYCTYIQRGVSLTDSHGDPVQFFLRKAVDTFKKVAKEDSVTCPIWVNVFWRTRGWGRKGMSSPLRMPLPLPWGSQSYAEQARARNP